MPTPSSDSRPVVILILGIISMMMCQPLGIVAIIMARAYERDCELAGTPPDQLATIGKILGIIATIFFAFAVCMGLLYLLLNFGLVFLMILLAAIGAAADASGA